MPESEQKGHTAIANLLKVHGKAMEAYATGPNLALDPSLQSMLNAGWNGRCHMLRVESIFSVLTNYTGRAYRVSIGRLSAVSRTKVLPHSL